MAASARQQPQQFRLAKSHRHLVFSAVRWFRPLDASLSQRRPGFGTSSVWVLWWAKWQWDRFVSEYLQFSPVSIIPPMYHISLHLHVVLTRRTNGRSVGNFQKAFFFFKSGSIWQDSIFIFQTSPPNAEISRYSNHDTAWKTEEERFYIPDSYKKMFFSKASGPALQPSQPSIQLIPVALSSGVKWPGNEVERLPASVQVRNDWSYTFAIPYGFRAWIRTLPTRQCVSILYAFRIRRNDFMQTLMSSA